MQPEDETGSLADEIQRTVEDAYLKLQPICRPGVRSNNVTEWTVLAGVVAVDQNSNMDKLRLISIATGVKSLPDTELKRSNGKILHDCHAEILAIRGLNRVLLEHANYLKTTGEVATDLLVFDSYSNTFRLKEMWGLALYISALPCGDASMTTLRTEASSDNETQAVVVDESDLIQYVDGTNKTILRGRMNYEKLGIVRTKPGRIDSLLTLSKSCSDKLCIKQVTSILNCMTWSLITGPVYLKYLIIPLENVAEELHLQRSLHKRIENVNMVPMKILKCHNRFLHSKSEKAQKPSAMASVKLFFNLPNLETSEQAILNGLRNGFYTKKEKPLRKNSETIVSRYAQWKFFQKLNPEITAGQSYLEFKRSQHDRKCLIEKTKRYLSPDGWISTHVDNVN